MVRWNGKWDALILFFLLLGIPIIAMMLAIVHSAGGRGLLFLVIGIICIWFFSKKSKSKDQK